MAYDLSSSRQCNICLLFPNETTSTISNENVSKCSGCHLVVYCGREHQMKDWPLHRSLCRAVQKILKAYNSDHPFKIEKEPENSKDLERAIALLKHLLRITLRRTLYFHEEELTSFPAYCAVCFSFKKLRTTCASCRSVSYCSPEHAKDNETRHQRHCIMLRIYYCQHKVESCDEKNLPFNGFLVRVPKLQNMDLFDAIQYSTKVLIPKDPTIDLNSYQHFAFVADFSSIATICYALEHVNMSSYENMEFRIFVVGATVEHLWFQPVHTRFFFLQYPKIERLSIYYIGPETAQNSGSHSQMYLFLGKRRTVNHITYKGLFQDFIHSCMIPPSLVVAFNCGFAEHTPFPSVVFEKLQPSDCNVNSTWSEGLREILLTTDVPFLFTSFTRSEADDDFTELLKAADNVAHHLCIGVNRIIKLSQNPYRDLRPLRNWQITDGEEIYYRNGYVQLVKSSVKK